MYPALQAIFAKQSLFAMKQSEEDLNSSNKPAWQNLPNRSSKKCKMTLMKLEIRWTHLRLKKPDKNQLSRV